MGFVEAATTLYYYWVKFEWDRHKSSSNQKKRGVSFKEASTIFGDPDSITFDDPDHSAEEDRFLTIGKSKRGRVLIVAHTERSNAIRIVSARKTTISETKSYEEEK